CGAPRPARAAGGVHDAVERRERGVDQRRLPAHGERPRGRPSWPEPTPSTGEAGEAVEHGADPELEVPAGARVVGSPGEQVVLRRVRWRLPAAPLAAEPERGQGEGVADGELA